MQKKVDLTITFMIKNKIKRFYEKSLHRQMLELYIKDYASFVNGRTLDVGSKSRRYDSFFAIKEDIIAVDLEKNSEKNIIFADVCNLPFSKNYFKTILCFEVLEYVINLEKAINEISRVLKNEGNFIFSVPFLNPVHGDGNINNIETDSIRLTSKGWSNLLSKKFSKIKIIPFGNKNSLVYAIFFSIIKKRRFIKFLMFPFVKISSIFLLNNFKNNFDENYPSGYFIICKK